MLDNERKMFVLFLDHQNISKQHQDVKKNDLLAWGACLTLYRIALYSASSSHITMLAYGTLLLQHVDKKPSSHLPASHRSALPTWA